MRVSLPTSTLRSEQIRSIIRQYLADYAEDEMLYYLRDKLVAGSERIYEIAVKRPAQIQNLYLTGEYVTEDEVLSARHISGLPQEEIRKIVTPLANSEWTFLRRGTYSVSAFQPSSPGIGSRLKMHRKRL